MNNMISLLDSPAYVFLDEFNGKRSISLNRIHRRSGRRSKICTISCNLPEHEFHDYERTGGDNATEARLGVENGIYATIIDGGITAGLFNTLASAGIVKDTGHVLKYVGFTVNVADISQVPA